MFEGVFCQVCPKGHYCPGGVEESPRLCSPGSYSAFGKSVCTPCPDGFSCADPTNLPVPCGSGQYSSGGGTSCVNCPAGMRCKTDGTKETCNAGELCSVFNQVEVQLMPAGSTSSLPAGPAVACPAGTYSADGDTSCTQCPSGSWCPAANHAPIVCPDGTYTPGAGASSCTICPVGYSCAGGTMTRCATGTFTAYEGGKDCQTCTPGSQCEDPTALPTTCDANSYRPAGSAFCEPCPGGFECHTDRAVPTECPDGYYSLAGKPYCKICPAMHECPDKARSPVLCEPYPPFSTYKSNGDLTVGLMQCEECKSNACQTSPCPAGSFPGPGNSGCVSCPFGHHCNTDNNGLLVATKCAEGQVVRQDRNDCMDCPAGYACPSGEIGYDCDTAVEFCPWDENLTGWRPCEVGYFSIAGQADCEICPAGFYCNKQDEAPKECPDGWFADLGQTYCTRCLAGHDCLDKTGRHNVECPHGTYYDWLYTYGATCKIYDQIAGCTFGDTTTTAMCTDCPSASFCPVANGGDMQITQGFPNSVQPCVQGTWSRQYATRCILAQAGFRVEADNTAQRRCGQLGNYSPGGTQLCIDCPAGHECTFMASATPCPIFFWADSDTANCVPCPAGMDCRDFKLNKLSPNNGHIKAGQTNDYPEMDDWASPRVCGPGFFTMPQNFYCVPCPIGHYCPQGALVATKCAPGEFAGQQEATCTACPPEYWSSEGEEYCTPVPPGMKTIATVPGFEICPHEKYSMWGENTCNTCPDGWLCPRKHNYPNDWTYSCPRGSYCIAGVQTMCPKGYFGTMERAKTEASGCEECPAGYDCQEGTEHFIQVPCPLGFYCPDGKAFAHPCPAGTFGEQLFARSTADCTTCDVGSQCTEGEAGRGSSCEQGYYCPKGSAPYQYPCPAGTYGAYKTGKRDLSECLPCPPGHYCPEATADPIPAPIGYYAAFSGLPSLESLFKCPPAYYCPDTGMTSYKAYPCNGGHYCPLGTSLVNQFPCPEGTWSDRQELHDATQCLPCPKGYACTAGTTSATLLGGTLDCPNHKFCPPGTKSSLIPSCPVGTYAPYLQAKSVEDCLPCPPGEYCLAGAGPADCPQGYYCPEGTEDPNQFPCPAGTYQPDLRAFSDQQCQICGIGNACPTQGMTTLASVKCPDGFYNNYSTVAVSCTPCTAGHSCKDLMTGTVPMSPHPAPCAAGYYAPEGAVDCTLCPVGTFCALEGTSEAQMLLNLCPQGTYCSREFPAASGTFVGLAEYPDKDNHGCIEHHYCPAGTKIQMAIPPGTMVKITGAGALSSAIELPAGWYEKTFTDTLDIVASPAPTNTVSSTVCNPGFYCPPGSFLQVPCPAGTFRSNYYGRNVSDCGKCPSGTYCQKTGLSQPGDCPMGAFCPEGSIVPIPCPRGTYNPALNKYDSRDCTKCDPGFYCPFLGQIAVDQVNHQCDKGFLCLGGANRPEPTDNVSGSECPTGYYCVQAQGAAGTVDPATDAYVEDPPLLGGDGLPESCLPGQQGLYRRAFQIADCIACLPGYYCPGSGGTSPAIPCTEGYFCPSPYPIGGDVNFGVAVVPTTLAALEAPLGYYAPLGFYQALPCNIGTYTDVVAQPSCKGCPAGSFCDTVGTSDPNTQKPCPAGYFCESYDATQQTCVNSPKQVDETQCYLENVLAVCPTGTYAGPFVGGLSPVGKIKESECVQCPAGKACPEQAMSIDTTALPDCAAGYFCISGSYSRYPTVASPGKYGPCPAGYYCPAGTGDVYDTSVTNLACPIGTFSNQERAISLDYCIPCPPGYMCEAEALTAPQGPCPQGSYCSYTGTLPTLTLVTTQCIAARYCPLGQYNEFTCPAGFFQLNINRGLCEPCPAGSFCADGNLNNCPKGYYCE